MFWVAAKNAKKVKIFRKQWSQICIVLFQSMACLSEEPKDIFH